MIASLALLVLGGLILYVWRTDKSGKKLTYYERHRDARGVPQRWESSPTALNDYKECERTWSLPPSTIDN